MRIIVSITGIVALLLTSACANSGSAVEQKDLNGRWEVVQAKRNGKLTRTFSNAFFEFDEQGSLLTNFTGEDTRNPYELEGNEIRQISAEPLTYRINEWEDSTFLLDFEYSQLSFEFLLKRTVE